MTDRRRRQMKLRSNTHGCELMRLPANVTSFYRMKRVVIPSIFKVPWYNIVYFQLCVCFVTNSQIVLKIQITFSCS